MTTERTTPVTISKVLHPITGEVLAFEITANDGQVYFVTSDPFWDGLRVGNFPDGNLHWTSYTTLPRQEISRLE